MVGHPLNTKQGLRLHTRLCQGARMGLQNRNFQCIGSYYNGPLNLNISKSGISSGLQNKRGATNFFKPIDASFKFGGIQIRGKNAAMFQLLYLFVMLCVHGIKNFWFGFLILKWLIAFSIVFFKGLNAASL